MITRHILKMKCGVTVEMNLSHDPFKMECFWTPDPPFSKKLFKRVEAEYLPWRDQIFKDFAKETGQRVLVITL